MDMHRLLKLLAKIFGIFLLVLGTYLFFALGVPPYAILILPFVIVVLGGLLVYKGFAKV
jgi:hypothetical protein